MLLAFVTSSATLLTFKPAAANLRTASSPLAFERAVSTTSALREANCRQISNPIPRFAPVTTMTGFLDDFMAFAGQPTPHFAFRKALFPAGGCRRVSLRQLVFQIFID